MTHDERLQPLPGKDPDFLIHSDQWSIVWMFEPISQKALDVLPDIALEFDQKIEGSFILNHGAARRLAIELTRDGFILFNPRFGYFARQ